MQERARDANRIQKVLETANIKQGAVATEVLGASGRAMLRALIAGEREAEALAGLAQGRLRNKAAQLREELRGRVSDHHRFMLQGLLAHVESLDQQIAQFDARVEAQMRPLAAALERLDTITGVARRSAEQILAELGDDMSRLPTGGHAASWTGVCPGNHESAGKRQSGKYRKGNRWLRATLIECARGAVRAATRRRSIIEWLAGVATRRRLRRWRNSILVAAWHILRDGVPYRELGPDHFDRLDRDRLIPPAGGPGHPRARGCTAIGSRIGGLSEDLRSEPAAGANGIQDLRIPIGVGGEATSKGAIQDGVRFAR